MQDYLEPNEEQYLPLRESVFNTLRKAILTGELKPGERLMEIHLANKLGVSRTPIREAIRKLELEGLVKIIPRSGAQVAQISEQDLKDVLEIRRSLDILCARLASERITPEEKERLQRNCEHFEQMTMTGDQVGGQRRCGFSRRDLRGSQKQAPSADFEQPGGSDVSLSL